MTEVTHIEIVYGKSVYYSSIYCFANISRTVTGNRTVGLTVSSELAVVELPPTAAETIFTDLTLSESSGTPEHETEFERTPSTPFPVGKRDRRIL